MRGAAARRIDAREREEVGLFERHGAALWAQRARTELARLGRVREPGGLTPAERRVVVLAAEGRSNKEIAAELFVSVHTVELHLSHAYAKLGVRSRAQLGPRLSALDDAPSTET